jgi:hypothetical protein
LVPLSPSESPRISLQHATKMNLKHLSFVMLVLQNTALSIVSKYSRHASGPKYRPSTAVLLVETLKFLICFFMVLRVRAVCRLCWHM